MEVIKVSSKSTPKFVAGAIAKFLEKDNQVDMQIVGAASLNQAIKALAIARGYLAPVGKDLVCVPAFATVVIAGEERTAIKLVVESRN